jgi:hypothetical protein
MALRTAASYRPGTVADLAERAQVGYSAARYTASRLVRAGELVPLNTGRPAMLSVGSGPRPVQRQLDALDALDMATRSFWDRVPRQDSPGSI